MGNGSRNGTDWRVRDRTGKTGEGRGRRKREAGEGNDKITPLLGDVQEYVTFYEERGVDTNTVWIVQHHKRPKRWTRVGAKGYALGQTGPGCPL